MFSDLFLVERMADEPVPVAPHRGFSTKAREILIGDDDVHLHSIPQKSSSDFDLRRKLKACSVKFRRSSGNTNDTTPKSPQSSTCSMEKDQLPQFDAIGEAPIVKHHKKLGQIGKTRSCMEFKNVDKRLLRTYQEENIIKMPSISSDIDSIIVSRSDYNGSIDSIAKASLYAVSDEQKKKDVKKWLMEKTD